MKNKKLIEEIAHSYKVDKNKRNFPDHICAKSNRVSAAVGELSTLTNSVKYDKKEIEKEKIKKTAINVIVQAIRFIEEI